MEGVARGCYDANGWLFPHFLNLKGPLAFFDQQNSVGPNHAPAPSLTVKSPESFRFQLEPTGHAVRKSRPACWSQGPLERPCSMRCRGETSHMGCRLKTPELTASSKCQLLVSHLVFLPTRPRASSHESDPS